MIEFFVAKRYLRAKHKLNFITIISLLSTLGITIGVAALIIVLSVFNGFGSLVTSIMVSFDPHIRISITDEKGFTQINSVRQILSKEENISSYSPYVEGKAILLNKKSYEIVNLKGIEYTTENESWGVASKIISGDFDLKNDKIDKIILGIPLRFVCPHGLAIRLQLLPLTISRRQLLPYPFLKRKIYCSWYI